MVRIKLQGTNPLPIIMQPIATTEQPSASTVQPIAYKQSIVSNVPLYPNQLAVRDSYVISSPNENISPSFGNIIQQDGTVSVAQPKLQKATSSNVSSRRKELAMQRLEEEEKLREARDKEYLKRKYAIEEYFRREYALLALKFSNTEIEFANKRTETPVSTVNPTFKIHSLDHPPIVNKPKCPVVVFHPPKSVIVLLSLVNIVRKVNILSKSKVTTSSGNNNRTFGLIHKPYKMNNRSLGWKGLLACLETIYRQPMAHIDQVELLNAPSAQVISNVASAIKSGTTNQRRISRSTFVNENAEYIPWIAESCTANVCSSSSVSQSPPVVTTSQSHELDWLETIDQTANQPNQNKILLANSKTNDSQPTDYDYIGGAPPWLNQKWAKIRNKKIRDQNFVTASNSSSPDINHSITHSSIANHQNNVFINSQSMNKENKTMVVQSQLSTTSTNNVQLSKFIAEVVNGFYPDEQPKRLIEESLSSFPNWSSQWKNPSNGRPNLDVLNVTPLPSRRNGSVAVSKLVEDSNLNDGLMPTNDLTFNLLKKKLKPMFLKDQATPENNRSNGIIVEPKLIQQATSKDFRSKFIISEQTFKTTSNSKLFISEIESESGTWTKFASVEPEIHSSSTMISSLSNQTLISTQHSLISTLKLFVSTHFLSNVGLNTTPIEIKSKFKFIGGTPTDIKQKWVGIGGAPPWLNQKWAALKDCRSKTTINKRAIDGRIRLNYQMPCYCLRDLLVTSSVTSTTTIRSRQMFSSNIQALILVNPCINPWSLNIHPTISMSSNIQLFGAKRQQFMSTIIAFLSKMQMCPSNRNSFLLINSKDNVSRPSDSRCIGGAPPKVDQKWAYYSQQLNYSESSIITSNTSPFSMNVPTVVTMTISAVSQIASPGNLLHVKLLYGSSNDQIHVISNGKSHAMSGARTEARPLTSSIEQARLAFSSIEPSVKSRSQLFPINIQSFSSRTPQVLSRQPNSKQFRSLASYKQGLSNKIVPPDMVHLLYYSVGQYK